MIELFAAFGLEIWLGAFAATAFGFALGWEAFDHDPGWAVLVLSGIMWFVGGLTAIPHTAESEPVWTVAGIIGSCILLINAALWARTAVTKPDGGGE